VPAGDYLHALRILLRACHPTQADEKGWRKILPSRDLLLVESHRSLARSLRTGLEEEGFGVHAVFDADKTPALLSCRKYAAIIVDIPTDTDGQMIHRWRQSGITTPVLILSTPGSPLENFNELGLGPGAFLAKPFGFDTLLDRLATLTITTMRHDPRSTFG